MAREKREKVGWRAKRREEKRLKQERTGDTREKKGERSAGSYSAQDMADRAASGGVAGGGIL
jgi:hypothetical protein